MIRNRDTQRVNKANKAIQACLYSRIGRDTIKLLISTGENDLPDTRSSQLLQLAQNANQMLHDNFCKTQTSLSKKTCDNYADKQHSIILRAIKNNENIRDVEGISKHILDEDLIKLYAEFRRLSDIGMYLYVIR